MSFTTTVICDHPGCGRREDDPNGHQAEPDLFPRWATIYVGTSLAQKHLCPGHLQFALRGSAEINALREAADLLVECSGHECDQMTEQAIHDLHEARAAVAALTRLPT